MLFANDQMPPFANPDLGSTVPWSPDEGKGTPSDPEEALYSKVALPPQFSLNHALLNRCTPSESGCPDDTLAFYVEADPIGRGGAFVLSDNVSVILQDGAGEKARSTAPEQF